MQEDSLSPYFIAAAFTRYRFSVHCSLLPPWETSTPTVQIRAMYHHNRTSVSPV